MLITLTSPSLQATLELYCQGYDVPVASGLTKGAVLWLLPSPWWRSVADFCTKALLFDLLYAPTAWSQGVNTYLYSFVVLVLQASQVHNITVPGGQKYNIPTENITIPKIGCASTLALTSYTRVAVAGADDFNDNGVTIKDIFNIIVGNTREVTPTCKFSAIDSYLFILLICLQSSRSCLVTWVCAKRTLF